MAIDRAAYGLDSKEPTTAEDLLSGMQRNASIADNINAAPKPEIEIHEQESSDLNKAAFKANPTTQKELRETRGGGYNTARDGSGSTIGLVREREEGRQKMSQWAALMGVSFSASAMQALSGFSQAAAAHKQAMQKVEAADTRLEDALATGDHDIISQELFNRERTGYEAESLEVEVLTSFYAFAEEAATPTNSAADIREEGRKYLEANSEDRIEIYNNMSPEARAAIDQTRVDIGELAVVDGACTFPTEGSPLDVAQRTLGKSLLGPDISKMDLSAPNDEVESQNIAQSQSTPPPIDFLNGDIAEMDLTPSLPPAEEPVASNVLSFNPISDSASTAAALGGGLADENGKTAEVFYMANTAAPSVMQPGDPAFDRINLNHDNYDKGPDLAMGGMGL